MPLKKQLSVFVLRVWLAITGCAIDPRRTRTQSTRCAAFKIDTVVFLIHTPVTIKYNVMRVAIHNPSSTLGSARSFLVKKCRRDTLRAPNKKSLPAARGGKTNCTCTENTRRSANYLLKMRQTRDAESSFPSSTLCLIVSRGLDEKWTHTWATQKNHQREVLAPSQSGKWVNANLNILSVQQ